MKKYIIQIILTLGCWVGIHAHTSHTMASSYDILNPLSENAESSYDFNTVENDRVIIACPVPTNLQWTNTSSTSFYPRCTGIAGYSYVFRYRASGTSTWIETGAVPCTVSGTVQTYITGLTMGTTYEWQVKTICSVGDESTYSTSIFTTTLIQSNITLGTLSSTNYCMGNSIYVPFTSTLPSGTYFTAILKRGSTIIKSNSSTSSPISLYISYNQLLTYGTDYTIEITSGMYSSNTSPNLTIGTMSNSYISDENNHAFIYSNDFLCTGKTKVFYSSSSDPWGRTITDGLNFQWKKDGTDIVGATSNKLSVSQGGKYIYVVTQGGCSVTTSSLTLQVGTFHYQSVIPYGDLVSCSGTNKRVESSYYSNTATYQWIKDGVNISGATNRAYDATQSGMYSVNVTDGSCSMITDTPIGLTFGTGLLAPIRVSGNDTTLCGADSKFMYANSSSINPTEYTYQWKKDGIVIGGATSPYYDATQSGVYSVTYSQGTCNITSKGVTLVSSNLAQKPIITAGTITNVCDGSILINQDNNNGNNYNLYGVWYKNDVMMNSYASSQYNATTSGTYKMIYGLGSCANESNAVTVSVGSTTLNPNIYIPSYYGSANLCGTSDYLYIEFDKRNISGGTYTYQWKKNGVNLSGETNYYLFVNTPGNYSLFVSNGNCSGISNSITVTNNTPVLSLSASENNTSCSNRTIKLDIKDGDKYTYLPVVWIKDGVIIASQTSSSLYTNESGIYTATYSENGCSGTTLPLTINTRTSQPTTIPAVAVNSGQTATLSTGGCLGAINWYDSPTGGSSLGTGTIFTTPSLTTPMTYYADCTVNGCSSLRTSGNVSLNVTSMYSLKTGNWDDVTVWSYGRVPNSTDVVTIKAGHQISIPTNYTANATNIILETGSNLIHTASNLCLSCP